MPDRGIDDLVSAWQRERILWANFVEVLKVETQAPGVILRHHDWIGYPIGVLHFSHEAGLQEFCDLLAHAFTLGLGKLT